MAIGGSQKFFVDKLNLINRDMFEPYILTLVPEGEHSFFEDLNLPEDKIVFIHFRSYFDLGAWFKIIRFIRKEKFDIVFTTLIFTNTVVRMAAFLAGVRNIIKSEDNIYPGKKKIYFFADRVLSLITKRILAISYVTKESLVKVGNIPPGKIRVTYAGIDLPLFEAAKNDREQNRKKFGFADDEIIIISVGRISIQKGYDTLIKTARILKEKKEADKFRFVIIGKHDTDYGAGLRGMATNLGVEDIVEFWGIDKRVPDLMAASDIFFLPSRWEGFCIVLAEAMAAGLPFVANNVGFVSTEDRKYNGIKNGECGFIVEDYSPEVFAESILRLVNDKILRDEIREKSPAKAKDFSIQKSVKEFEDICLELARPE